MIEAGFVHRHELRVYYEDVDLAGIVYYANYLRFIERARSELLRDAGIDQTRLKAASGLVFVVRRCDIEFLAPARFDDWLTVSTRIDRVGQAKLEMTQAVSRGDGDGEVAIVRAALVLACIDQNGRPGRLRAALDGGRATVR